MNLINKEVSSSREQENWRFINRFHKSFKKNIMEKSTNTTILLLLIAISMQFYLSNHDGLSEKTVCLTVPIMINILLFLIWISHQDDSEYGKAIEKNFTYFGIISGIYCAFFLYMMALGGAYKN